jgi:hypothetical protein
MYPRVYGFIRFCTPVFLVMLMMGSVNINAEEKVSHKGTLEKWEFYGSVRLETSWWQRYRWYNEDPRDPDSNFVYTDSSFQLDSLPINKFVMGLQNNSRFGARGRGERFGYGIELGLASNLKDFGFTYNITPSETEILALKDRTVGLYLRKLYGDWFIVPDFIQLRVGQDWALANFFPSSQIFYSDAGLGYSGILFTGRHPLVKLSVGKKADMFDWLIEAAIVKPRQSMDVQGLGVKQHHEEKIPKVELGTILSAKPIDLIKLDLNIVGGMASYDIVVYADEGEGPDVVGSHTVASDVVGADIGLTVWKIRASFTYSQGKNLSPYGVWMGNPFAAPDDPSNEVFYPRYTQLDTTGASQGYPDGIPPNEIANAHTKQGGLVVNIQVLPWLALEGGAAKIFSEHDDWSFNPRVINAFDRSAYYGQMQFRFADNHITIIPEWSYSDFGGFKKEKDTDGGGRFYAYGVKWQIDI